MYFYLINRYDHNVLDIPDADHGTELQVRRRGMGAASQLWKWDDLGRLVSKTGLVAEVVIEVSKKKKGTRVHGLPAHNGLSQQWRVEDGLIKSNLNNKALGLYTDNQVRMYPPDYNPAEHWDFVPEECLEKYEHAVDYPDPFSEAVYWREVADNYMGTIIGCDIDKYEHIIQKACEVIETCAKHWDKVAKDTGIANTTGGAAGIVGGTMALVGLLLAPFSAGASLGLTAGGAALGAAGGATTLTGGIISHSWDDKESKKAKKAIAPAFRATLCLQGFLNEYTEKVGEAIKYLSTSKGKEIAGQVYTAEKIAKDVVKGVMTTYKVGKAVCKTYKHIHYAKEIKSLVTFIRADYYQVAKAGLATKAAASGVSIPKLALRGKTVFAGKTVLAAGSTAAKGLSGTLAVVGVAFGIYDVVSGSRKISNGSDLAKEFRKTAKDIKEQSNKLIEWYYCLQKREAFDYSDFDEYLEPADDYDYLDDSYEFL